MLRLLWWWTGSAQHIYFPPPQDIAASAGEWFPVGWSADLAPTVQNIAVGYLISVAVGVTLGIAIGSSSGLSALPDPLCELLRAISTPAVVPLLLVLFGFNDRTRIFIVVLGAIWPILLGAIDGTRGIDRATKTWLRSTSSAGPDAFGASPCPRRRSRSCPGCALHPRSR